MEKVRFVVSLFLAVLFFLAGAGKVLYLSDFRKMLYAFRIIPVDLVPGATLFLVVAEISTGLSFPVRLLASYAALSAIALLLLFTASLCI